MEASEAGRARPAEPLDGAAHLLEAILRHSADGVVVYAPDGRRIYVNDAGARLAGFGSAAELLAEPSDLAGGRIELFHADRSPMAPEELPSRQVLAGAESGGPTVVRFRRRPGRDLVSEVRAVPLRDGDGSLQAVISYFRDTTSETLLAERQRVAAEVSRVVGASLELQATLDAIVHVVVPELADWCYLDMLGPDGRLERVVTAAVDPRRAGVLLESTRRWPNDPDETGALRVVTTGEPHLIPAVTDEHLAALAKSSEHLSLLRGVGYCSYLCVPVRAGARVVGALTLVTAESGRQYDENDVPLAQDIAARAAAALENAELYREAQRTSALLDSLYDSAPIGLGFWDRELRYVRVNDALARINERSPEDHVGKTFAEVIPQLAHVIEPIARRVLETNEPVVALEVAGGTPSRPGQQRDWLASYYPVRAADGLTLGVGAVIEEVTDRRRAERQSELQHAVTHVLGDADLVADAIPRVLEIVCEKLGWDAGCYWPVDPDRPQLLWARPARDSAEPGLLGFLALTERTTLAATPVPGRVARTGRAEWLSAAAPEQPARASVADAEGLRSSVVFPISADGAVVGVVELLGREARVEDPEQLASLAALGAQIGQFLLRKDGDAERASLLERERRARAEAEASESTLRKLQRVSEAALQHLTLHELLSSLLERIVEVLDAETSAILLIDDDGLLRVRATIGLDRELPDAIPIPVGQGMAGRVAAERAPLVVADLSTIKLVSPVLRERGINSVVAIPLVVEDEVIGVVHAGSSAYAHFSDDDAQLLELIADRIALAINQASLLDAEQVAQERLRFLGEASAVLASSLDLDLTLQRAAQLATLRFCDAAVIDLVVGERLQRVVIEVAEGRLSDEVKQALLANAPSPEDTGGSTKVVRTGEPEILLALDADPGPLAAVTRGRPSIQQTVDQLRPKSLVYMPLKVRGEVLGVLALIRTTVRFDERDVETVRELAARAAVAVDNAYLYREAERGRERLELLAEASELLGSTLDVETTLEQLGTLVAGSIADLCAIHLVVAGGDARLVAAAKADPLPGSASAIDAESWPGDRASPTSIARVLADGQAVLFTDPDFLPPDAPERAAGVHTGLSVPLVARGQVVGALTLVRTETAEKYSQADVELAADVARRAATALDNARLFHEAQERAQAARVLDSVGDGVFLVDGHGVLRTWNRAAAAATGLRPADVIDRLVVEVVPGWAAIVGSVPVAATGVGTPRAESLPLDLGGRELWLSLHGVSVPDGIVYAFRDLTEERALEAMRNEFVSTVSHELRTPLAAIYGAAMTLRRSDVALTDEQRGRLLDVVSGEADRLARTVNDILWASRLDAGSLHVSIQRCDPFALAHSVVEAQRAHLDSKHEILLTAEDDLAAMAGDPDKVGRVLINLVDNAVKYSPEGGRVEVRVRQTGGHVRFSILDSGLGIPLAEQRRIFEKFYRLDPNMNRGVGGTGLGLYICRELLRRMDGQIWVESAGLGEGSTFHMELPVAGTFAAGH